MVESDAEDISKYTKTYPKTLSGEGKFMLRTMKSHLELYSKLKSIIPHEELHPQGSKFYQVLVSDSFLEFFIGLYKENPKMKDDVYFCLFRVVVEKMTGYHNPSMNSKA